MSKTDYDNNIHIRVVWFGMGLVFAVVGFQSSSPEAMRMVLSIIKQNG